MFESSDELQKRFQLPLRLGPSERSQQRRTQHDLSRPGVLGHEIHKPCTLHQLRNADGNQVPIDVQSMFAT